MTQEHIEDIIRMEAYPLMLTRETLYVLDRKQIEEIAQIIAKEIDAKAK